MIYNEPQHRSLTRFDRHSGQRHNWAAWRMHQIEPELPGWVRPLAQAVFYAAAIAVVMSLAFWRVG